MEENPLDTEQCQLISPPTLSNDLQWGAIAAEWAELDIARAHDQYYQQYSENVTRLVDDICSATLLPPDLNHIVAEYVGSFELSQEAFTEI